MEGEFKNVQKSGVVHVSTNALTITQLLGKSSIMRQSLWKGAPLLLCSEG
jgi:hypothetical protein